MPLLWKEHDHVDMLTQVNMLRCYLLQMKEYGMADAAKRDVESEMITSWRRLREPAAPQGEQFHERRNQQVVRSKRLDTYGR